MKNLMTKEPAPKKPGTKRPKCSEVYVVRLTKRQSKTLNDFRRTEKRKIPVLMRENLDRAIAELQRKRQTPDERRIKIL